MENVIIFEPTGGTSYAVGYRREVTPVGAKMGAEQLKRLVDREPYNFEAALALANLYTTAGDAAAASAVRFAAATTAVEALPEDDETMELEWENDENQEFLEVIASSGGDCYLWGDFEMAATMFETALALDSEDHFNLSSRLAMSYIAIDEAECYAEVAPNLSGDEADLAAAFADFKAGRAFKLTPRLRAAIESQDELWYRHLPIFETYSDFR